MSSISETIVCGKHDSGNMPDRLAQAANSLEIVAAAGMNEEWRDCAEAEHFEAQLVTLQRCKVLLDQIESIRQISLAERANYHAETESELRKLIT